MGALVSMHRLKAAAQDGTQDVGLMVDALSAVLEIPGDEMALLSEAGALEGATPG